jgi:large subunit ribosomal protein L25
MKVVAFPRTLQGTGASRRLRIAGQTPGIVYGGKSAPLNITVDHNALYHALKKEVFHSSILDLEIDGKVEKVLLRDFQVHAYKQLVLHVDFQRIDESQKVTVKVPVHFINGETSPAAKAAAAISHIVTELEVSCLPKDLPEFVQVDLASLEAGGSVHLADIQLPAGVTAVSAENITLAGAAKPAGAAATEEAPAAE